MKGKESQNVRRQMGFPTPHAFVSQAPLVATSARRVKENDLQRHVKLKGDLFAHLALNLK